MERADGGAKGDERTGGTGLHAEAASGAERDTNRGAQTSRGETSYRAGMEGNNAMMPEKIDRNTATSAIPQHSALELTEGGSLAQIVLNDQIYTLRITRAGKLILTK